jgi:hypothetical protein
MNRNINLISMFNFFFINNISSQKQVSKLYILFSTGAGVRRLRILIKVKVW